MIKIIHTCDWHANKNFQEFKKSFDQLLGYVIENKVNLVVISGDIFDSRMFVGNKYAEIIGLIKHLANYCSVLILYGTPSHDFKGCFKLFEHTIESKYPIKIIDEYLDKETTVYYLEDTDDEIKVDRDSPIKLRSKLIETELFIDFYKDLIKPIAITGMAWPMKYRWLDDDEMKLPLEEQNKIFNERIELFLNDRRELRKLIKCPTFFFSHLQLEGTVFSNGQDISSDNHPVKWVEGLADYTGLGHIHKAQKIKTENDDDYVYYAGSIYNKTWGEMEEKSFAVITVENNQITNIEKVLFDTPKMIKIKECSLEDYKRLKESKKVEGEDLKNSKVWITLNIVNKNLIDIEKELEYWKDYCDMRIDIEIIKTGTLQRLEEYDKSISLVDKFELFCKQKQIKPTEFQINKIKELK